MNANRWAIQTIQTDRGSEFFGYQDGETKEEDLSRYEKESLYGKFTSECEKLGITHKVIPTGSHEKRAEAHFSWLSKAIDAMLFEARLSPIFWADAAKYALSDALCRPGASSVPILTFCGVCARHGL